MVNNALIMRLVVCIKHSSNIAALLFGWYRDRFPVLLYFLVTYSFRPHHGPGVDTAPSENEYQELFLGKRRPVREADDLTTFNCRIWEPKPPGTLWATAGPLRDSFFTL